MHDDWATLLQAALIGTERPWALNALPTISDNPVAQLLREAQALSTPDAPGQLLRLAGALAVCHQAGWVAPLSQTALTPPAGAETRRLASPAWAQLVSQALAYGSQRLTLQVLHALDDAGLHLPTHLLPELLNAGRQSVALRGPLLAVLGERGRWLATHQPDWAYAGGAAEQADSATHWTHGSLAQRLGVLQTERQHSPGAARERLAADWRQLPAKDRAALLPTLRVGLSADDEVFLNAQLKDRAQDVRRIAADLLAALPSSAYSQRMVTRMAALLLEGGVQAPTQTSADWKDEQLETERPPYEKLGERAWWLFQLTRRTPLVWWSAHTGLEPAALVELAQRSDWTQALLRGWYDAVLWQPDARWCVALLRHDLPNQPTRPREALLALLPTPERERQHIQELAQLNDRLKLTDVLASCLAGCSASEHWGLDLSQQLLVLLRQHLAQGALLTDYLLRQQLPELACTLHPQALPELLTLARQADESSAVAECWHRLLQAAGCRQTLFKMA